MSTKEDHELAALILGRLIGVDPDDQDLQLDDEDWERIVAALAAAPASATYDPTTQSYDEPLRHVDAASAAEPAGVQELMLCEQQYTILKPDTLYRFSVDEGCQKCRQLAKACVTIDT